MNISVICCYNNLELYHNMLYRSVISQTFTAEMIGIDNRNNQFKSAAQALNYGASQASGDILLFIHQDVDFRDDHFFESLINYFHEIGDCIIGLAGVSREKELYSNLVHGKSLIPVCNNRISSPQIVETIDELFIGISKLLFEQFPFDEQICQGWHLYGVDLCLITGKYSIYAYVIPCNAHHLSIGLADKAYYKTLDSLVRKYKNTYKKINTTSLRVKTDVLSYLFFRVLIYLKRTIRYMIRMTRNSK